MEYADITKQKRAEKALSGVDRYIDILFDRAPVMMHSIDGGGRIIKVNRRWLQRLGYKRDEVLGQKSIDFLTEESRAWAIKDTLPLFWRVGSARGVGYQSVRKNGRTLDVLLDAEVSHMSVGNRFTIAALRDNRDLVQWEQASTTIMALQQLTRLRHDLESVLSAKGSANLDPKSLAVQQSSGHILEAGLAGEAMGALLELAQDISANLRGVLRVYEEWLGATVEQQREMLLMVKSIDKTLADLADSVATARQTSEERSDLSVGLHVPNCELSAGRSRSKDHIQFRDSSLVSTFTEER